MSSSLRYQLAAAKQIPQSRWARTVSYCKSRFCLWAAVVKLNHMLAQVCEAQINLIPGSTNLINKFTVPHSKSLPMINRLFDWEIPLCRLPSPSRIVKQITHRALFHRAVLRQHSCYDLGQWFPPSTQQHLSIKVARVFLSQKGEGGCSTRNSSTFRSPVSHKASHFSTIVYKPMKKTSQNTILIQMTVSRDYTLI